MRVSALLLVCALLAASPSIALAADCKATYTTDQLLDDINAVSSAIRDNDKATLDRAGKALSSGLVCMGEPVKPQILASVYRAIGVYYTRGDTPAEAPLWFRTARELDPTFQWDINEVSQGSTTYTFYEAAKAHEGLPADPIPGKVLNIPANSQILLDGRPLTEAAATPDRYHLVQQVSTTDKTVRAAWIIKGNAIPDRLLRDATQSIVEVEAQKDAEKEKQKREKKGNEPQVLAGGYTTADTIVVERERPPGKTPLIVLGGVTMLAAGGVYAASFPARTTFEGATNEADLYAARTLTNSLVLASGGVLMMGVGFGAWGVLLDGKPTVGINVTW